MLNALRNAIRPALSQIATTQQRHLSAEKKLIGAGFGHTGNMGSQVVDSLKDVVDFSAPKFDYKPYYVADEKGFNGKRLAQPEKLSDAILAHTVGAKVVLVGTKPQIFPDYADAIASLPRNKIVMSIMAAVESDSIFDVISMPTRGKGKMGPMAVYAVTNPGRVFAQSLTGAILCTSITQIEQFTACIASGKAVLFHCADKLNLPYDGFAIAADIVAGDCAGHDNPAIMTLALLAEELCIKPLIAKGLISATAVRAAVSMMRDCHLSYLETQNMTLDQRQVFIIGLENMIRSKKGTTDSMLCMLETDDKGALTNLVRASVTHDVAERRELLADTSNLLLGAFRERYASLKRVYNN